MLKTLKVYFDGRVLVPDGPLDLPLNEPLELTMVAPVKTPDTPASLDKLAALAQTLSARPSNRFDRSIQHDHYLYGTPRQI